MASKNHRRYKKRRANIHVAKPLTAPPDETAVFIRDWRDLVGLESESHYIEFSIFEGDKYPHAGNIYPKEGYDMVINGFDYKYGYYLSTHTFYGRNYKTSERILRSCGFNVRMNNWDAPGSGY